MAELLKQLLEKDLDSPRGPRLLWTGNDGWLLSDGEHLIAIDPDWVNPERLAAPPIPPEEAARGLDLVLLTHAHEDHFSTQTCEILLREGVCRFVLPESCAAKAEEIGIPKNRIVLVRPGDRFAEAGMEVECVRAIHGHVGGTVYSGASTLDCGYRFRFGGRSFYEPGDTLLLEEHQEMAPVDVLFVSPTEHNTWINGSKWLMERLAPKLTLAQHFGTYEEPEINRFWAHGYVEELREVLSPADRERYRIPVQGEIIHLD